MENNDNDCVIVKEIICHNACSEIEALPAKEDISRVLECPVCFNIPFGPIVMCTSGHSICRDCTTKIIACPVCQSNYTNTRCLALESLISMMKYACPNKDHGCKEILPAGGRYNMHTWMCDYRDVTCKEKSGTKCYDTKVPFSEYIPHLQIQHRVKTVANNSVIVQSIIPPLGTQRDWPYTCFLVDNINFLQKCEITESNICWWICVHSNREVAEQYIASLVLSREHPSTSSVKRNDKNDKVKWKIPVLSIQHNVDEKSPEVAVYPLKDLLKLCNPPLINDGKKKYTWELEVNIQKKMKRHNKISHCCNPKKASN